MQPDKNTELSRKGLILKHFPLVTAGFVTCVALLVIFAWQLRSDWLVTNVPRLFYMQHMTATLFLLSSASLLLNIYHYKKYALASGSIVVVMALAILLQYTLGVDFGLDQLLIDDYIHPESEYPGRPAPNTAVSFLATGIALLLLCHERAQTGKYRLVIELIGFIIFALGAHAIGGVSGVCSRCLCLGHRYTHVCPYRRV